MHAVSRRKFLGLTAAVVCASVFPVAPRPIKKRNPKRRAWRRRMNRDERKNINQLERTIFNEIMRDARDIRRLK